MRRKCPPNSSYATRKFFRHLCLYYEKLGISREIFVTLLWFFFPSNHSKFQFWRVIRLPARKSTSGSQYFSSKHIRYSSSYSHSIRFSIFMHYVNLKLSFLFLFWLSCRKMSITHFLTFFFYSGFDHAELCINPIPNRLGHVIYNERADSALTW